MPGNQNKMQSTMLMTKSLPAPDFKKTATGGSSIARMIKTILLSICIPLLKIKTIELYGINLVGFWLNAKQI